MRESTEVKQKLIGRERPLLRSPWLALIVLPLCTTLTGVLAALWLNSLIADRVDYRKTLSILDITVQECTANNSRLAILSIADDEDPPFLPSLGIAAVSLYREATLLNALSADDFTNLVRQLAAVTEAHARYGMLANQLASLPRPNDLPPSMVPPGGVSPLQVTRDAHVRRLVFALGVYKKEFLAFCDSARTIRTKHNG